MAKKAIILVAVYPAMPCFPWRLLAVFFTLNDVGHLFVTSAHFYPAIQAGFCVKNSNHIFQQSSAAFDRFIGTVSLSIELSSHDTRFLSLVLLLAI